MADLSKFYVITPYFNSQGYRTRPENYRKFAAMCRTAGANLITVEVAFGDRPFEVTERDNPFHLQYRSVEELWLKENMINCGIRYLMQLDPDAKQIAWIDSDCFPMSPAHEWFAMTVEALDRYEIVQMWEWLINFGPDYDQLSPPQRGFMASYFHHGFQIPKARNVKHTLAEKGYGQISMGGPGLAWAANVSALNKTGGLLEVNILGSGDWHMAHGLLGLMELKSPEHAKLNEYSRIMKQWQRLAVRHLKKDVGFVKMTLGHWFHGCKQNRFYGTRGSLLIECKFNPDTDLKHDNQGLLQLETHTPRQIMLRDRIRLHMASRNEDSVPFRSAPNFKEYGK